MNFSQPIKHILFLTFLLLILLTIEIQAQSILLISSGTKVYDNYNENKVAKLNLTEDTWVNYKGRYGDYFKISNFFGKDKSYPYGVYDGYVSITSVLDTATREEYETLVLENSDLLPSSNELNSPVSSVIEDKREIEKKFDIDRYFIGMSKSEAISNNKSSIQLGRFTYKIELKFDEANTLSEVKLIGDKKDALAVDGLLKQEIVELNEHILKEYGKPTRSNNYPSFLEIAENKIYIVSTWSLPTKNIVLGVGEKDDLFYSSLIFMR